MLFGLFDSFAAYMYQHGFLDIQVLEVVVKVGKSLLACAI